MRLIRLNILLLLFAIVIGCSSNDFAPQSEQQMMTTEQVILEQLNDVDAKIYLELAEQQLKDLEDYMNLLMDDELDLEFKTNIKEQIQGLFYLSDTLTTNQGELNNWMNRQINEEEHIQFTAIKLLEESVKKGGEQFTFTLQLKVKKKSSKNQKVKFLFSIIQVEKTFGDDVVQLEEVKMIGLEVD